MLRGCNISFEYRDVVLFVIKLLIQCEDDDEEIVIVELFFVDFVWFFIMFVLILYFIFEGKMFIVNVLDIVVIMGFFKLCFIKFKFKFIFEQVIEIYIISEWYLLGCCILV